MIFESTIQEQFFPTIIFSDERERQVFFSYIRGFTILSFDPTVKRILEIGGGQSTALIATMGAALGWRLLTIDMNPDAVSAKLRSQLLSEKTLEFIDFKRGFSISPQEIRAYYENEPKMLGGVNFREALECAKKFIKTDLDARKAPRVVDALSLEKFTPETVVNKLMNEERFSPDLITVFRTAGDELDYVAKNFGCVENWLVRALEDGVDAVYLDSGEFSSLPEWSVVHRYLRPGGYVVLHDIFFPKSFKNWMVCGALTADPEFEVLYVDDTTPQGFLVARRRV